MGTYSLFLANSSDHFKGLPFIEGRVLVARGWEWGLVPGAIQVHPERGVEGGTWVVAEADLRGA